MPAKEFSAHFAARISKNWH